MIVYVSRDGQGNVNGVALNPGCTGLSEAIETPTTLAARWSDLMTRGFPEEVFEVRADVH